MADETEEDAAPKKKAGKGLLVGLVLAVLLGGGGFYAVFSGVILGRSGDVAAAETDDDPVDAKAHDGEEDADYSALSGPAVPASVSDVAFLPVEPVVVSLAGAGSNRHLRFRAELEVPSDYADEVEHLMPRVIDVMNAYLRAVDPASLSSPGALIALRAQILRRLSLVIGAERVTDVLVMEFVLS